MSRLRNLTSRISSVAASRTGRAAQLRILAAFLGIAQGVLVARLGGIEVKGVSAAFAAASMLIFQVANLDLGQQIVRFSKNRGAQDFLAKLLLRTIGFFGVAAAVVVALTFRSGGILPWLAIGSFALLANMFLSWGALASRGPVVTAWSAVVQQAAFVVVVVALAAGENLTETSVKVAVIAGYAVPLPLLYFAIPRMSRGEMDGPSVTTLLKVSFSSLPWHLGELALAAVYGSGVVVVAAVQGAVAAGIYSVALGTARLGQVVSQQVVGDAFYRMNRFGTLAVRQDTRRIVAVEGSFAAFIALAGYWLIPGLYGQDFLSSYWVALVLLPGSIAWSLISLSARTVRVFGVARDLAIFAIPGLLVLLAMYAVLVPSWGALGAALSSTTAIVGMSVAAHRRMGRVAKRISVPSAG